jgi:hypothetical protein
MTLQSGAITAEISGALMPKSDSAIAVCEDTREQVWVCQYQPPGNWVGHKPY